MIRLCLAGDLMLGRGIDQILKHPGDPRLYEDYAQSALDYVSLAENANGPIPRSVDLSYVWGDASTELDRARSDCCIVNLETAITNDGVAVPKGINYRMTIENAQGLRQLKLDCCTLANNHILDWGPQGLLDTLNTLQELPLPVTGAGRNASEARAPAVVTSSARRILVFGIAFHDSGVPRSWASGLDAPGVNLIERMSASAVDGLREQIEGLYSPGDVVVASIHWGGNWGYEIPSSHRRFAHDLIDCADVDVVHGHSSHHPKGLEFYKERLVLYGCGDLINDYEGITGHETFRNDLSALYFVDIDEQDGGRLAALAVTPLNIRRFSLKYAAPKDADLLCKTLNRECLSPGRRFAVTARNTLLLAPS